jgi:hypothetical protein
MGGEAVRLLDQTPALKTLKTPNPKMQGISLVLKLMPVFSDSFGVKSEC